ncbi:MAG TPA: hypothetical protein VLJ58_21400 [Ramlibacter sp.]|nr:hypothetical protein [Ramlibacter sp.]
MSAEKQPDVIKLVAVERGFAMNRMVHPGETFDFRTKDAEGKDRKIPKWAQLAGTPLPKKKAPAGDLKPKNAQAAVSVKRGQLSGDSSTETDPAGDLKPKNGGADLV